MKKILAIAAITLATAGTIMAATDKLKIYTNGNLSHSIAVDNIYDITYPLADANTSLFQVMKLSLVDGTEKLVKLQDMTDMRYETGTLADNPFTIDVEPHHMCATLHVQTTDPQSYFRIIGVPASRLAGMDESLWADVLMQQDLDFIHNTAAEAGRDLSSYEPEEMFWQGSQTVDWYPSEIIDPETPIALCIYNAELRDERVVPTSEPQLIRFTTKKVEDLGVKFDLTLDLTSTRVTVKADAIDSDIPFCIELYTAEDVYQYGLVAMVSKSLQQMEQMVYRFGNGDWSTVTFRNHGEKTYTNRLSGDPYVAVAFGCEYGVTTTDATVEIFVIPLAEAIDDCSFDYNLTQLSPAEVKVDITPSNPSTHYIGMLVENSALRDEEFAEEYYFARHVWAINTMNSIQWTTSDLVHTGASSFSTYNTVDGKYLKADTDYTLLVCGIDEEGTRTTELTKIPIRTTSTQEQQVSFDVRFSNFDGEGRWTHSMDITVIPSDRNAKYVFAYLKSSNAYANLDCTDQEFATRYVDSYGSWLELLSGEKTKRATFDSEYEGGEWVFGEYTVFVFGYEGALTSPLYAWRINTTTGEVTQVR